MENSKVDKSSLSNPSFAVSTNILLDWNIDFDAFCISGSVVHSISIVDHKSSAKSVDFDTANIEIRGVQVNNVDCKYELVDVSPVLGSRLSVFIPDKLKSKGSNFTIKIDYAASKTASAIQWLDAPATKGGKFPFVFTQCQAIHARSLLPCMDTPGVKATYSATVRCPEWCTVLMSAVADDKNQNKKKKSKKDKDSAPVAGVFSFNQTVPIPSYLIALAAGSLASKPISNRVKVWAEPEVVDAAAFEFSETESFLQIAESLTCPYVWGRYDILCLPPSFPYGGMENPCLTFATPTLLAGDRSLADVIAHEIAHSWTGNLVTNHTWEHFWLNEGWTVWLERKITKKAKGDSDDVFKISAQIGYRDLYEDVTAMMTAGSKFTSLCWPLNGEDPDVCFSKVPYEKGFNFLYYLETLVGSDKFEKFAKAYIEKFKFGTVTSADFKEFFLNHFKKLSKDVLVNINWDTWFHGEGMPPVAPNFENNLATVVESLAKKWISHAESNLIPLDVSSKDIEGWSTKQKCLFFDRLLAHSESSDSDYSLMLLEAMDKAYSFTACNNAEVKLKWQLICLRSDAAWIVPHVVDFITSQGRMKFVRPLYQALRASQVGSEIAVTTFKENAARYHPIARKMVEHDLEVHKAIDEIEHIEETVLVGDAVVVSESVVSSEPEAQNDVSLPEQNAEPTATPFVAEPAEEVEAVPSTSSDNDSNGATTEPETENSFAASQPVVEIAAVSEISEEPSAVPSVAENSVAEEPVSTPVVEEPVSTPVVEDDKENDAGDISAIENVDVSMAVVVEEEEIANNVLDDSLLEPVERDDNEMIASSSEAAPVVVSSDVQDDVPAVEAVEAVDATVLSESNMSFDTSCDDMSRSFMSEYSFYEEFPTKINPDFPHEFSRNDTSSYSNPLFAFSTHIHLDWTIDFHQKLIKGHVVHNMLMRDAKSSAISVDFDINHLEISQVLVQDVECRYEITTPSAILGSKLSVFIPDKLRVNRRAFTIRVDYVASELSSAIQWLDAPATKGGKFPFVFTQCQAIHARSLLPCMDTPGVKTSYSATVRCPEWCTVLMSALALSQPNSTTFRFNQPVPIPSYLIALAAGSLASKPISNRVKVWAEPEVVDAAAFEFSETESFLQIAESLTCPYVWGRYDILCLPPSFPYGGMENPCLTFATPTLLAGDRSLADVIAHEIAHSWTGNLVTNHTWEHFWLNEGWTVWLERKITKKAKGDSDDVFKISAQIGYRDLYDGISGMGFDNKFTSLCWPLNGEDPDSVYSEVPYEKGFCFLHYLENIVGSAIFEKFSKAYIEKFKFGSVTSGDFKDFFLVFCDDLPGVDSIDWDTWFHGAGMPPVVSNYENCLATVVESLANKWISHAESNLIPLDVSSKDIEGWSTKQKCLFFDRLSAHSESSDSDYSLMLLEAMDKAYSFTACNNAEVKLKWQLICLRSDAAWIVPHVVDFITSQGRMKFVRPLYQALRASQVGSEIAMTTFKENAARYHPITRKMVSSDLESSNAVENTPEWANTVETIVDSPVITPNTPSSFHSSASTSSTTSSNSPSSESSSFFSSASFLIPAAVAAVGVAVFAIVKSRR